MQVRAQLKQVRRRPLDVRTPGPLVPGVSRLLVARCDRLGDVVLTLPAVAALRDAYPAARLSLLVRPAVGELARMVCGVDAVYEAAEPSAAVAVLRDERPDLAVCVSRGAALALAAARARVRCRVGTGLRWYSPLFHRRVVERRRHGGRHEVEYALGFAHRAGATAGSPRFPLAVPETALASARDWLSAKRLDARGCVLLHPGSGGSCPAWPLEHWAALAHALSHRGQRVVVSIGPEDAAAAPAFRGFPLFDGGLAMLAALMREVAVVAANSTGPLHLAAALGTPSLGVYSPWSTCSPERWGPYADNGWALVACTPAERWTRRVRRQRGGQVMAAIAPDLVGRCIAALAAGRTPESARAG